MDQPASTPLEAEQTFNDHTDLPHGERTLAGLAHLALCTAIIGFPSIILTIGIWIYAISRKPQQHNVAFQAAQSAVLQVAVMFVFILGIVTIAFLALLGYAIGPFDSNNPGGVEQFFFIIMIYTFVAQGLAVLAVLLLAGYALYLAVKCFNGTNIRIPVIGTVASWMSGPTTPTDI